MFAQTTETVGTRALGMGGAFVAVASDSSATWWNPAALASGPFLDVGISGSATEMGNILPARGERTFGLALGIPPAGVSYYRFRVTDIGQTDSTDETRGDREERRVGVPIRSLTAGQLGLTLVQTLASGFHVGATLKYARGAVHTGRGDGRRPVGDLLDQGDALNNGSPQSDLDLDLGVLAVAGPVRLGALVRHLREPSFGDGDQRVRLRRQARIGFAFDGEPVGGPPFIVSVDADVRSVTTATGERRNVAFGMERWLSRKRLGLRGGGRLNTVGRKDRTATVGASVAVRAGLFLEAYAARGRASDEQGWGLAARVSF